MAIVLKLLLAAAAAAMNLRWWWVGEETGFRICYEYLDQNNSRLT